MSARFTAGQVAWAAGADLISGAPEQTFAGVFTDSRTPVPGALFVALVGERFDGSQFAAAAAQAGAAGVLVPAAAAARIRDELAAKKLRPALLAAVDTGRALGGLAHAWRASLHDLKLVCVTGSTGKTSTKELVAAVLETSGPTLKTEGNLNNEVGVPIMLLRLTAEHRNAVIEAGMNHLGEVARLAAWADPDVGLVTNVGPVHLEGTGSLEGVAHAKGELFHALRESATAVANADDPRVLAQARLSRRRLVTFGASTSAHIRLISAHHGGPGLRVELAFPDTKVRMAELHLIGTHNGYNAAAAAGAAFALGIDPDQIIRGLGNARTTGRRMRPVRLPGGGMLIDDCYNANPQSTKAALLTLTHLVRGKGRAIAVLGDMLELGPTELDLHRDVGRFAAGAGLSLLVCFGSRARAIGEGATEAGIPADHINYTEDPAEAVEMVRRHARPQDVILVKGSRGMKMERISDPLSGAAKDEGAH
ncbi:MAG TPA: UDP-N-acetylmuramoyl-tripeptide--D-alanyl-D-alanine ligase [Myxococcales bacterium]|nr:UDP-N-acetylmuramoyl-tripeptide--D-alanyl-D-alanine ligase [Myxococcales bacterium]